MDGEVDEWMDGMDGMNEWMNEWMKNFSQKNLVLRNVIS